MNFKAVFGAVLLSVTHFVTPAVSQEIITDKGKTTLEIGASYLTTTRPAGLRWNPYDRFIENKVFRIGAHYGLSEKTEIYAKAFYQHEKNQVIDNHLKHPGRTIYNDLSQLTFGINHRIKGNDDFGIVNFNSITLANINLDDADNIGTTREQLDYGSSLTTGLRFYGTYDPVVISATFGYIFRSAHTLNLENFSHGFGVRSNDTHKPGNVFFFTPKIDFKVSDKLTLKSGLAIKMFDSYNRSGQRYQPPAALSNLELGIAYKLNESTTFLFDTSAGLVNLQSEGNLDMHFTLRKSF